MTKKVAPQATIKGRLYVDVNKNNVYDRKIDIPLAFTRIVLVRPNAQQRSLFHRAPQTLANTITDAEGRFGFITYQVLPNETLNVALESKPDVVLKTVSTDNKGDVDANVPLPTNPLQTATSTTATVVSFGRGIYLVLGNVDIGPCFFFVRRFPRST